MNKPFYHVKKRTLLAIAGCVWLAAGCAAWHNRVHEHGVFVLAAACVAGGFCGVRADVLQNVREAQQKPSLVTRIEVKMLNRICLG